MGVETLARSVEQGCEVPCLERGSVTVLRHWANRASASGAEGDVEIGTSMSKREKG